jgi:hypothetical protein
VWHKHASASFRLGVRLGMMRIADEWISDVARCATAREWVGAMASVRFVGFRMRG